MNHLYSKLCNATISLEEFLSWVNRTQLDKAAILEFSKIGGAALAVPSVVTLARGAHARVRLLSGLTFCKGTASPSHSIAHILYGLEQDIIAEGGIGGDMRIGPFEPILATDDIRRLRSFGPNPALVLEICFGGDLDASHGFMLAEADASANKVSLPNSYSWAFEDRYLQTYTEGGESWETLDHNSALEPFIKEYGGQIKDIIDLGTGEGRDAIYLAENGFCVTGVDIAATGLAKARSLATLRGVAPVFLQRDVVHLRGLADNSFDAALNMGCLHLIDVPEQRAAHLKRVYEILRPGGLFLLGHCRNEWLKDFWSVDDFELVKGCETGALIKTRIRKSGGGSFVTDMPILRHSVRDPAALAAELRVAGFKGTGEYEVLKLSDLGNICVLLARKPFSNGRRND